MPQKPGQANSFIDHQGHGQAGAAKSAFTGQASRPLARQHPIQRIARPPGKPRVSVADGYIDTESLTSLSPAERTSAANRVPMRRFGTPAEVAAAVRFFACSDASYITGSALKVDGGVL